MITQANWLVASSKRVPMTTATVRHSKNRIPYTALPVPMMKRKNWMKTHHLLLQSHRREQTRLQFPSKQKVSPCIYVPVELITEYWTLYLEKPNNSVCDDSQDCNAEPPAFDITYNLAFFLNCQAPTIYHTLQANCQLPCTQKQHAFGRLFCATKEKGLQCSISCSTHCQWWYIWNEILDSTSCYYPTWPHFCCWLYSFTSNISKIKINSSAKVIIESHAPNLVCIQFWLLLLMLKISTGTWEEKFTKPCWGGCTPSPSWCQSQENRKNQGIVHQLAIGLNVNGLQAPQEVDIHSANLSLNDKINALCNQWECNVTNCCSEHCFVLLEGPHFTLSHTHLKKWGAAIVCYLIVVVVNWLWIYVT